MPHADLPGFSFYKRTRASPRFVWSGTSYRLKEGRKLRKRQMKCNLRILFVNVTEFTKKKRHSCSLRREFSYGRTGRMQRRSSRQFYIAQAAALRESVVGSSEEEPAHEKHPFSEPWEDSDLILVVENEKFHVHRQILSIHSPVFKAMLNSQFKERTAKEIPLPGKKADEMLEFLKQLYVKEKAGVTMKNVEHILKLADEYQVKGVIDLCIRCLQDEPKNEFNVVKILYLANRSVFSKEDERLEEVQDQCYNYIQDMELTDIILNEHFDDLEKQTMKNVLIRKAERLENILKRIYPQFLGLLEYCMWLCYQKKRADLQWCPIHYVAGVAKEDTCKRMTQCSVCKKMIMLMISQSFDISSETGIKKYCYGGKWHFDRNLIQVVKDLKNIVRFDPDFDL